MSQEIADQIEERLFTGGIADKFQEMLPRLVAAMERKFGKESDEQRSVEQVGRGTTAAPADPEGWRPDHLPS